MRRSQAKQAGAISAVVSNGGLQAPIEIDAQVAMAARSQHMRAARSEPQHRLPQRDAGAAASWNGDRWRRRHVDVASVRESRHQNKAAQLDRILRRALHL